MGKKKSYYVCDDNKIKKNMSQKNRIKSVRDKRNKLPHDIHSYPISKYLGKIYEVCTPSVYGLDFPKKIVMDMSGMIQNIPSSFNRGELRIGSKFFFNVNISFSSTKNSFAITQIKNWHDYQYHILCFVSAKTGVGKFYCVPKEAVTNNPSLNLVAMTNSSVLNSQNSFVNERCTIKEENLDWTFERHNLLESTKYSSLKKFIRERYNSLNQ